jgi:hypothetical protein
MCVFTKNELFIKIDTLIKRRIVKFPIIPVIIQERNYTDKIVLKGKISNNIIITAFLITRQ